MPGLIAIYDPREQLRDADRIRCLQALRYSDEETVDAQSSGCAWLGLCTRGSLPGTERIYRQGACAVAVQGLFDTNPAATIATWLQEPATDYLSERPGSFTAGLIEPDRITLLTDRYATHPLYYWGDTELLIVTTQVKALLALPQFTPRWHLPAISAHLQLGYVTGDDTLLTGVRTVPPGTYLTADAHGFCIEPGDRIGFHADTSPDWNRQIDEVGQTLKQATARACVSEVSIGVPLSGGLDSRALLATCPEPQRVPSFTFGVRGARDVQYAADIARRVGSPHTVLEIETDYLARLLEQGVWLSEGHLGAIHFHILPHVPAFAQQVPVVLDGIAGDALIGGKYVKDAWLAQADMAAVAHDLWHYAADAIRPDDLVAASTGELNADLHAAVGDDFRQRFLESHGQTPMDRVMDFMVHDRTRRFIGCGAQLLRWKVEVLMPFYDGDLVDAISQVPHAWRKRDRFYTAMLRRIAPAAAAAPWQKTALSLRWPYSVSWLSMAFHKGAETLARRVGLPSPFPNREFSDYPNWLRGPLKGLLTDVLLSERCLDRGLLNPDFIRRVVAEHLDAGRNHAQLLGTLLTLETFGRQFMDREPPTTS